MKWVAVLFSLLMSSARAQVLSAPFSESVQLQRLVEKTEAQLKAIQSMLELQKQDAKSVDRAAKNLDKLSAGLDRSIEQFQGTKTYQDALLKLQSEAIAHPPGPKENEKSAADFSKFQNESVRANLNDLQSAKQLEDALKTAEPGFVPKIQSQAQLGSWQANTRVSAQLTELLSSIHSLTEKLDHQSVSGLDLLVQDVQMQNEKQRKAALNERN